MAVQSLRHVQNDVGGAAGMVGAPTGVGQVVGHQEQRVAAIVERTVHQQLVAVFRETDPLPQKAEVGIRSQRGAGQHHRLLLLE